MVSDVTEQVIQESAQRAGGEEGKGLRPGFLSLCTLHRDLPVTAGFSCCPQNSISALQVLSVSVPKGPPAPPPRTALSSAALLSITLSVDGSPYVQEERLAPCSSGLEIRCVGLQGSSFPAVP
ncbi:hypothetical protein AOLI_G00314300 [Acnodon oligacanthus]